MHLGTYVLLPNAYTYVRMYNVHCVYTGNNTCMSGLEVHFAMHDIATQN